SPPAPGPSPRASRLSRLHVQVRARQRASSLLEELDVPKPPPIGAPFLGEPHGRGQRFLDGHEVLDVALHRKVLDDKTLLGQHASRVVFVVSEPRAAARLLPLIGVEGYESDRM